MLPQQPALQRLGHGLATRVDVQFLVNVAHMLGDRIDADAHFHRGGLIVFTAHQQI
jgi:hypothetical protein